jgi:sodium transport system permease protein
VRAVLEKEILDHGRDRRSLLATLILPAVGPLALVAIFQVVSDIQQSHPLVVPVQGAERAPLLMSQLEQQGVQLERVETNPIELVKSAQRDAALVVSKNFEERSSQARSAKVTLYTDAARPRAAASGHRLELMLVNYSQELGALRLLARGVSPEILKPLQVDSVEVSSQQKRSAQLLNVVPLLLMLSAFVGGMNIAIDATAGERERGSLEPLLNNPITRAEVIVGKWLTTTSSSTLVALISSFGFLIAGFLLPLEELDIKLYLGPAQAVRMFLCALPLAPFGAALQMLVASTARSFKEAQTYLNLLNFLPMMPAMFLMLHPSDAASWMALIPTVAQVTSIVDILEGESPGLLRFGLMWGSTLLYTAVLLWGLSRVLEREKTVFGR